MLMKKKKAEEEEPSNFGHARLFKYKELKKLTNSFGTEIGSGGFGRVYLGTLPDGREVAVKVLFDDPKRVQQFFNEVTVLSRLRHKNLVTLYGCTNPRSQELLLVYDYVPNGTVAEHLHGQRSDLTLAVRIQIALETAEALAYLHALEPPVIHRDVKTPNLLLDHAFHVKVADLGMCRLMPWDATHVTTVPQGTMGYRDPEYERTCLLTDKSDVYSLGVVLMDMISGQQAVDVKRDPVYLESLALKKILNKNLDDFVDPKLGYHSNRDVKRVINYVAKLAHKCLHPEGRMRPSMVQLLSVLKEIQNHMLEIGQNEVDVISFSPQRDLVDGSLNNEVNQNLKGLQNKTKQIGLNEVSDTSLSPQQELGDAPLNNETQENLKGIQMGLNKVDVISSDPQRELSDGTLALNIGVEVVLTHLGGGGGDVNEQKEPAGDLIPKPPQASTVVLKIERHCECEACTKKIVKTIRKVKGVEDVTVETGIDLVTVKGTMDMKTLLTLLKNKLNKGVEVVPQKKDDDGGKGGEKKTEGGGGGGEEKKKEGVGGADKKKEGGGGGDGADKKKEGDSGGGEENKKEGDGEGGAEKKKEGDGGGEEEKKNEGGGGGGTDKKKEGGGGGEEKNKKEGDGEGGVDKKKEGGGGGGEEDADMKEGCDGGGEEKNEGRGGGGADKKKEGNGGGGEEKKKEGGGGGGADKKKVGDGEKEEGKVQTATLITDYNGPTYYIDRTEMTHDMFSDENTNACSIM